MIRHLAASIVITAFTLVSLPSAWAAGPPIAYDTVDAIEVVRNQITVTGIIAGQSSPSTNTYFIFGSPTGTSGGTSDVAASRCDRLALLAVTKPGKYQFAVTLFSSSGNTYSCKLIVRTP